MKKVLAIDLDGTLLDSRKHLSSGNREALLKCAAGGSCTLVFCSGRNLVELQDMMEAMPFFHYAVLNNGGYLYDIQNKTFIGEDTLSPDQLLVLYDRLEDLTMLFEINCPDSIVLDRYYFDHLELINVPVWNDTIRRTCTPVDSIRDTIRTRQLSAGKINIFFPDKQQRDIALARVRDLPYAFTCQEEQNLEINLPGVDKGSALARLCTLTGMCADQFIAFGDNMNDLTMFDFAGYSVAMGNSVPEALSRADYVTSSNDEDGVAAALAYLKLI